MYFEPFVTWFNNALALAALEINKKAIENNVDMIIIGSCGKTGDMEKIFFGSTTEKVLRFIARPVLCVPPESGYRITPNE